MHFGIDAYFILKKYEKKQIRINRFNFNKNEIVLDFINKFGLNQSQMFFRRYKNKIFRCDNANMALFRFLKYQTNKTHNQILQQYERQARDSI